MKPWVEDLKSYEERYAKEAEKILRIPIPFLLYGRIDQASEHAALQAKRDRELAGAIVLWLKVIAGLLVVIALRGC